MEAFNIKIQVEGSPLTLTILPVDSTLFKVIYFGAILGVVRKQSKDNWVAVQMEELTAGDLPFYQHDPKADHEELELTSSTIHKIGVEIEKEQITTSENEEA